MRPDSLVRLWHYINRLLKPTYILTYNVSCSHTIAADMQPKVVLCV